MLFMLKNRKISQKNMGRNRESDGVGFSLQKPLQKNVDYKKAYPEACVNYLRRKWNCVC